MRPARALLLAVPWLLAAALAPGCVGIDEEPTPNALDPRAELVVTFVELAVDADEAGRAAGSAFDEHAAGNGSDETAHTAARHATALAEALAVEVNDVLSRAGDAADEAPVDALAANLSEGLTSLASAGVHIERCLEQADEGDEGDEGDEAGWCTIAETQLSNAATSFQVVGLMAHVWCEENGCPVAPSLA